MFFEEVSYLNAKYYSFYILEGRSDGYERKLVIKTLDNIPVNKNIIKYKRINGLEIDPQTYTLDVIKENKPSDSKLSVKLNVDVYVYTSSCITWTYTKFNCGERPYCQPGTQSCPVTGEATPYSIVSYDYSGCQGDNTSSGNPGNGNSGDGGTGSGTGDYPNGNDPTPPIITIPTSAPLYDIKGQKTGTNKNLPDVNPLDLNSNEIIQINAHDPLRLKLYQFLAVNYAYPFTKENGPYTLDEPFVNMVKSVLEYSKNHNNISDEVLSKSLSFISMMYYEKGNTQEAKDYVQFIMDFFVQNPNTTEEQFADWFLPMNLSSSELAELQADWLNPETVKPTVAFAKNAKLYTVYKQGKTAANFNQYLKNFDGRFSTANLLFDVRDLSTGENAKTSPPKGFMIAITFNSNKLDRPKLDIARTFMHEIIHAEIFRILLTLAPTSNGQINEAELTTMLNSHNYPGLYDYYRRFAKNWQHEQMAEHYRGIIKMFLKQIDNTITDKQLEFLSWVGLHDTIAWNNLDDAKQKQILADYNLWLQTAPK